MAESFFEFRFCVAHSELCFHWTIFPGRSWPSASEKKQPDAGDSGEGVEENLEAALWDDLDDLPADEDAGEEAGQYEQIYL